MTAKWLLLAALLCGCSQAPRERWVGSPNMAPAAERQAGRAPLAEGLRVAPDETALLASAQAEQTLVPPAERVMVYTASFQISVHSVRESMDALESVCRGMGGYVHQIDGDQITVRVPADQYNAALAQTEALGTVINRQMQALDVTEEYVDLQARLRNAIKVRDRLQELLAQAKSVEDTLAVEKELNRVNESIERLQAKLEVLKNRVAFCTITVRFVRVAPSTRQPTQFALPFDWLADLKPERLHRH